MIYRLVLPRPLDDLEDFCVLEWHKAEGQAYRSGDLIVEIETQKSVIEVRASADGALRRALSLPGDWLPFGAAIAVVSDAPDEPLGESSPDELPALDASLDIG